MSIATTRGDTGQTGLAGGIRISKASLRVDTYGTTDELKTVLGLARSLCANAEIASATQTIQRTLFRVGSALATPPESKKQPPLITQQDLDVLTTLFDNPLPPNPSPASAAAFNVARTLAQRAERTVQHLAQSGAPIQPTLQPWLALLAQVLTRFSTS